LWQATSLPKGAHVRLSVDNESNLAFWVNNIGLPCTNRLSIQDDHILNVSSVSIPWWERITYLQNIIPGVVDRHFLFFISLEREPQQYRLSGYRTTFQGGEPVGGMFLQPDYKLVSCKPTLCWARMSFPADIDDTGDFDVTLIVSFDPPETLACPCRF
jgi:hypothetical protein